MTCFKTYMGLHNVITTKTNKPLNKQMSKQANKQTDKQTNKGTGPKEKESKQNIEKKRKQRHRQSRGKTVVSGKRCVGNKVRKLYDQIIEWTELGHSGPRTR